MDPKKLKYAPTHEWVHLDGDVATVGLSAFAVEQLTDLIMIDLGRATPGATLSAGYVLRRGRERQVRQRPLRPPLRRGHRGQPRRRRRRLPDRARTPSAPAGSSSSAPPTADAELAKLLDHDAYQKRIAEESH